MHDLIERQAAIDVLDRNHILGQGLLNDTLDHIADAIMALPSAQPETHDKRTETHACDLISRQAAINALHGYFDGMLETDTWSPCDVYGLIEILPSAQPEQTNSWCINSWCINCKEYDTENKCCPRYNRVIKQTLDDAYRHGETEAEARFHAQQRWIPCSERLPEERQEILATTTDNAWGDVVIIRTYYKEMHKSVIAWMPLPEPYQEERRTDEGD